MCLPEKLTGVAWMTEATLPCPLCSQSTPWDPCKRVMNMEKQGEDLGSKLGSTSRGWKAKGHCIRQLRLPQQTPQTRELT